MGCANATCKTCQTCDKCQNVCDLKQNFCDMAAGDAPAVGTANQSAVHYLGGFNWSGCDAAGQTIFYTWTSSDWDRLQTWIKSAYEYGTVHSTAPTMEKANTNDIVTEKKYNDIVLALQGLDASTPSTVRGKNGDYPGDIIRSYHATNLETGVSESQIPTKNCNICNANCDSGCDTGECNISCQSCQTCVSCQGQQHYSTCYGSCYTPPSSGGGTT